MNLDGFEDRGLLSFILKAGEYVGPIKINKPITKWSPEYLPIDTIEQLERINIALNEINLLYYRPSEFYPVLRIEVSPSIASNNYRLAMLFESIIIEIQKIQLDDNLMIPLAAGTVMFLIARFLV